MICYQSLSRKMLTWGCMPSVLCPWYTLNFKGWFLFTSQISMSVQGPQGIICDKWSSEYSKYQGSNNWSFFIRVIFRDFGRRKLQTAHDGDLKSSARYHMVVPVCILSTISEGIEIDPSSSQPPPCALWTSHSPHFWQLVVFGFQRIISWRSSLNRPSI